MGSPPTRDGTRRRPCPERPLGRSRRRRPGLIQPLVARGL
jgi:hypothetical protein